MPESIFPFNSPSPQTPAMTSNVSSPETPQSPTPETLPIRTKPFNYLVANSQSTGETSLQTSPTPEHSNSARGTNPFDSDAIKALPQLPPKSHDREGKNSISSLEHSNGLSLTNNSSFSDEYTLSSPLKPWVTAKRIPKGSETGSINSGTSHTARRFNYPNPYPHRGLSYPSLTKSTPGRRDTALSLNREVRLREAATQQDRRLRLERERDEVRRITPSVSSSRLLLGSRSTTSRSTANQNLKNPIPSLIRNGVFWAGLLLAQTGLVSTGAAIAVILRDKNTGGNATLSGGTAFWLVSSIVALITGVAFTAIVCIRKGNVCLGTQERLGFNEIRDLEGRDLETGQGRRMLYLGVGDRDDSSELGGSSLRGNNSARYVRYRDGRLGEWVTTSGITGVESGSIKDPMWKDLYLTPSGSMNGGFNGSPEPRAGSKLRNGGEVENSNLDAQRLEPTTLAQISNGIRKVSRYTEAGLGLSRQQSDNDGMDCHINPHSTNSIQPNPPTKNDRASALGKEVRTWGPLARLERALSSDVAKTDAAPNEPKKFKDEEGMELAEMSSRGRDGDGVKEGKMGKDIKSAGKQVAEYQGPLSPELIQQRMGKRQEETLSERVEQVQAEKTKVEGVNVRERAKKFEGQKGN